MTVTINGATGETTPGTTFTGSTSGTILVQAASVAGTNTLTLPASTGTLLASSSGTITVPSGSGTAAVQGLSTNIVSGTVNAGGTNPFPASSGPTSVDFTGIPSWAKRITVMFKGVGLSASTDFQIQIGSGSVTTSGYGSSCATFNSGGTGLPAASFTSGFAATNGYTSGGTYGSTINGFAVIVAMPSLSYGYSSNIGLGTNNNTVCPATGVVTLTGVLDRVRITSVSGTALFNSGNINILWE